MLAILPRSLAVTRMVQKTAVELIDDLDAMSITEGNGETEVNERRRISASIVKPTKPRTSALRR